jgi:flagellar hook protein FlgE
MGLYGVLNASVSGMQAQSNKLSTISQNISNSATTGYKNAEAEFADLVSTASETTFEGAGVTTHFAYQNTAQGSFTTTSSSTDLAVSGNGFFVVQNTAGAKFLTRDGSFSPDSNGNLVNSSGYTLLGYSAAAGASDSASDLTAVNVNSTSLSATPTTTGKLYANVPSSATVVPAASLPSTNSATATYTEKTSLTAYNDLGTPVILDVYLSKTPDDGSGNPTWEVSVYNKADAAAGGGFPYANPALATQTLTFNPLDGKLTPPTSLSLSIPSGQPVSIDVSGMTQLDSAFTTTAASMNGSAASGVSSVSVGADGTLTAVYTSGAQAPLYDIPLSIVPSPDSLTPITGNTWQVSSTSGDMILGKAGTGSFGTIKSDTLESSTVDLATELTKMIQSQSAYEANSKVFSTGSTLLEALLNIVK